MYNRNSDNERSLLNKEISVIIFHGVDIIGTRLWNSWSNRISPNKSINFSIGENVSKIGEYE